MHTSHQLLIVDDDLEEHFLMQLAFAEIGWAEAVLFFRSAEACLQHLARLCAGHYPALLLLDYHMPGINGGALLDLLKKNQQLRHLPVVMYSTQLTAALKKALLQKGAMQCFYKTQTYPEALLFAITLKELCNAGVAHH